MADPTITIGSACTGVGMLDEAIRLGCAYLGIRTEPAFMCEWEGFAASVLLARMADASLEPCPIWCGDLAEFDAAPWRGRLDCFAAGFPCQPWSAAGKQEGIDDERWLWPELARIIRDAEPSLVFLENVPGLVSGGGLHHVLDDLADMRFDAEWCHLTAEGVGASHRRQRVFILAYRPPMQWRAQQWSESDRALRRLGIWPGSEVADAARGGQRKLREPSGRDGQSDRGNESLDIASGNRASEPGEPCAEERPQRGRRKQSGGRRELVGHAPSGRAAAGEFSGRLSGDQQTGRDVGNSGQSGLPLTERDQLPGSQRFDEGRTVGQPGGTSLFAPGPKADWGRISEVLYPATEPGLRLLVDGLALVVDTSRADQLRCAGNGVVALQGAVAFVELMRRAGLI